MHEQSRPWNGNASTGGFLLFLYSMAMFLTKGSSASTQNRQIRVMRIFAFPAYSRCFIRPWRLQQ